MKSLLSILTISLIFMSQADAARGRQPCSGSKGGISHCTADGSFICNDGSTSQSKRFCSGYGTTSEKTIKSVSTSRKIKPNKTTSKTNQQLQNTAEKESSEKIQKKEPTCAPLYMANKAGYTHLPICSGNQY